MEKISFTESSIKKEMVRMEDIRDWSSSDLSQFFWNNLIEFQKHPNKGSVKRMKLALAWACHADHGLSNSFINALHWCHIDLYAEGKRSDIPDEWSLEGEQT